MTISLNQRRWKVFQANRRGFYSLWILLALFCVTLPAEFIANDRPLLVHYQHQWFIPIINDYPETDFGGDLPTTTDFRDPYVVELIQQQGWMLWPMIPYGYDTVDYGLNQPSPSAPSWRHWLGTDDQGRDVLARVIYGFRLSVLFGLILTLCSAIIGIVAGALQGYFGGWLDLLMQRFLEVWSNLPQLLLLIIVSSVIAPGFWSLLAILLLFSWTALVAVVRAEFLRARNFDYVRAARALGVGHGQIMWRHVLPNAMVATLTFMPFILAGSIVALTSLDFLGLGLPPGSPSLGELLRQGKENLQAPWLGLSGFVVLAVLLSLLVFIGEGVRDAFDPHKGSL